MNKQTLVNGIEKNPLCVTSRFVGYHSHQSQTTRPLTQPTDPPLLSPFAFFFPSRAFLERNLLRELLAGWQAKWPSSVCLPFGSQHDVSTPSEAHVQLETSIFYRPKTSPSKSLFVIIIIIYLSIYPLHELFLIRSRFFFLSPFSEF